MDDGSFDYDRGCRYHQRCLTKEVEVLKKLIATPHTVETVAQVTFALSELQMEFEKYKLFRDKAFRFASKPEKSTDTKSSADTKSEAEIKEAEDIIFNDFDNLERIVRPYIAKAKMYISEVEKQQANESMHNTSMNTSTSAEPIVKLPHINIPKFDGNITNFLEFYALFQNLIHDEASISKVRKLYYLKDALIGDAANLVRDTPLTDRGYDEAWCLVISTYKDIKSITRKHFDQLFSISPIKSSSEIGNLLSKVLQALKGIKACGEDPDNWGPVLCYLVSEKLDESTYTEFEKTLTSNAKFPAWKSLKSFLESRASVTKRKGDQTKSSTNTNNTNTTSSKTNKRTALPTFSATEDGKNTYPKSTKIPCACCDKTHLLIDCDSFKNKSPRQRYEVIHAKSLCCNCFNSKHKSSTCPKPPNCKKCSNRHHTLLHFDDKITDQNHTLAKEEEKPNNTPPSSTCGVSVAPQYVSQCETSLLSVRKPVALLPSAVVNFRCKDKIGSMRILLDSCSQLNLISHSFVQRNNLPSYSSEFTNEIYGVGSVKTSCNKFVNLTLESRIEKFSSNEFFSVVEKLPYAVLNLFIDDFSHKVCKNNLNLADTAFYDRYVNIPSIDAVLGIEFFDKCVRGDTILVDSACLRDTTLGWTISSVIGSDRLRNQSKPYCGLTVTAIDKRLQRFWEIENIPSDSDTDSTERDECNKHFEETYTRNPQGHFVVRLPFKSDPNVITNNYDTAKRILHRTQGYMATETKRMYSDFMEEYKFLGHMSIVTNDIPRYFIPHHAVLRPSSTTTKLRVVFNASSKAKSGYSLNDILMVGPSIQPEMFDNLLCLRIYRHALTGDIEKMYRCIWVHEADRRFQSIIWEDKKHELNTITYGTGPASFIATKCLAVLAEGLQKSNPVAAKAILENFYMDDFISGANTINEVVEMQRAVHDTLLSGGFKLRKYQSNTKEILDAIDPSLIERNLTVSFGNNESLSILGLSWCPADDTFTLKSEIPTPTAAVTKRQMLSTISKVFDPLGLASPVTVRGKLMFQSLWKLGIEWDDAVPADVAKEFNEYLNDLRRLTEYAIPRYVRDFNADIETIFGFCDASERAYCATVYAYSARTVPTRLQLLCSKTRVAPVKPRKIPELELQAAVLLVQLVSRVCQILKVDLNRTRLYSDSTIVLAWLSKPPSEWKTFVRNRVSKIISEFPRRHWSHVRSGDNPADLATRGLSTSSLMKSDIWLNGPPFVDDQAVDNSIILTDDPACDVYRSKSKRVTLVSHKVKNDSEMNEKCSSYEKLRRIYATVVACFRTWRSKVRNNVPILFNVDVNDLIHADRLLIKITQYDAFSDDIDRIRNNRKLCKRSLLRKYIPIFDKEGILRSRTRLQNARIPFNEKMPIILPAQHRFTKLYARHLHEKFGHAGRPWLLTNLSPNYVFIGGISRVIKSVIHKCVTCTERFVKAKNQQMADLPTDRVTPQDPFQVVGIDFTGAFQLKCSYHRMTKYMKAYACIFVCFSTRAVHIELVPSLSTEDFLNGLKCFVSRRGVPKVIHSDNGTNFRGGERYLKFDLTDAEIIKYSNSKSIKWKFNPPYTPHRGGIWESAVKSAKRFIPKLTTDQRFSENELRTLLTEIECILNSRPLAYQQNTEAEEEVLTPAHFLIGRNITVMPEPASPPPNIKLSKMYRANQNRIRDFWRIWSQDYLNQLRFRSKWTDELPNMKVGEIVLVRSAEPCRWPLARVTKTFPDRHNLVRTVEIRLSDGKTKVVPTSHVAPLPID